MTVGGELELGGGIDASGNRIKNAYLENPSIRGHVLGDMVVEGGAKIGELATAGREIGGGGGARARMVVAGPGGELLVARGVGFDDDDGVFVTQKIAGHEASCCRT